MWQQLFDSLTGKDFMIVAVAEESRGAEHARQWIEQANANYWCLIDTEHRVADLFGMVNVPQAVWIDAAGRIVRPAETAGSTDHWRRRDPATGTISAADQTARLAARQLYLDAVKNWVLTDQHALDADVARRKQPRITPEIAEAQAHFRLGVWLRAHDRPQEADAHLAEASRLHPGSWNIWRQSADLDEVGKASGPEFRQRVDALGDRLYYPPPDLPGF